MNFALAHPVIVARSSVVYAGLLDAAAAAAAAAESSPWLVGEEGAPAPAVADDPPLESDKCDAD